MLNQVGMCESQINPYSSNGYNCDLRNEILVKNYVTKRELLKLCLLIFFQKNENVLKI